MITSIPNLGTQDLNLGSVEEIIFLPMANIVSLAVVDGIVDVNASVVQASEFASGDTWLKVDFIRESAKFTEEDALGPNGPYVKQKVSWKNAKHYDMRVRQYLEMREVEFCVVIIDTNRRGRMLGSIAITGEKNGARFIKESTTGAKWGDRNEYDCFFYMESFLPASAITYETGIVVDPPADPGGGALPITEED